MEAQEDQPLAKGSDTLTEGLRAYEIGEKLRALRLRKKMGLVELGKHTGLSPALLSKLERSKLFPPLPTLLRIAMVFGVGLDYFFTDERKRHPVGVVRRTQRKRFPERPDGEPVAYHFECLDFAVNERRMSAYFAEFEPVDPETVVPHQHDGEELLFVISGKLSITIGRSSWELGRGDSIYFDSTVPHSYLQIGKGPCSAIVVTAG